MKLDRVRCCEIVAFFLTLRFTLRVIYLLHCLVTSRSSAYNHQNMDQKKGDAFDKVVSFACIKQCSHKIFIHHPITSCNKARNCLDSYVTVFLIESTFPSVNGPSITTGISLPCTEICYFLWFFCSNSTHIHIEPGIYQYLR